MNARSTITADTRLPYPGLRPFRRNESDLFFGREGCVDDMVDKLAATSFLGVLGSSGSGKSSLVRTGMLDALDLGLKPSLGTDWVVVDTHPGTDPFGNLASALLKSGKGKSEIDVDLLSAYLRRGPRSALEWCQENLVTPGRRVLLLIDQFEELFRYGDYTRREEAEAFAALLLESTKSAESPLFVTLTMRSEFLGACSLITGLAERINAGLYLTPRMTREQCRQAIEGPAGVCGFQIEPALVNRMLNDATAFAPWEDDETVDQLQRISRRADQLPLMQHVLNRLWVQSDPSPDAGLSKVLTLAAYEQVGGMEGALDSHGAEILSEIKAHSAKSGEFERALNTYSFDPPKSDDRLVETVFRSLVSGGGGLAVRRPCDVKTLVELTGADKSRILEILDAFRSPDCNFLQPPLSQPLTDDTLIDLAHESLIRQWTSLARWADREEQARAQWIRLSDGAQRHAQGMGGLLHGIDLATNSRWWAQERPSPLWAKRYGNNYQLVDSFLETSRKDEAEAKAREEAQAQALRDREAADAANELKRKQEAIRTRQKRTWQMIGLAVIVGIVAAVISLNAIDKAKLDADMRVQVANGQELAARLEQTKATTLLAAFNRFKDQTLAQLRTYKQQLTIESRKVSAAQFRALADNGWLALADGNPYLAARYALAGMKLSSENDDSNINLLRAVEATSGYRSNRPIYYDGKYVTGMELSPDGKLIAVAVDKKIDLYTIDGQFVRTEVSDAFPISAAAFSAKGNYLYGAGSKGLIIWDTTSWKVVINRPNVIETLPAGQKVSSPVLKFWYDAYDDNYLATSFDNGRVELFNLKTGEVRVIDFGAVPKGIIFAGQGEKDTSLLIYGSAPDAKIPRTDNKVYVWNAQSGVETDPIVVGGSISKIRASSLGQVAIGYTNAEYSDKISVWDVLPRAQVSKGRSIEDGEEYQPSAFSPDGKYLVTLNGNDGQVWQTSKFSAPSALSHNASISGVKFSKDSRQILTASTDHTIKLWQSGKAIKPRVFTDDQAPSIIGFSASGDRFFTSTQGNAITAWDAITGERIIRIHYDGDIFAPSATPDGQTLVTGVGEPEVRITQVKETHPTVNIRPEHGLYYYVTSPNEKGDTEGYGTTVLTSSYPRTEDGKSLVDYELWNPENGNRIGFIESEYAVTHLKLSSNDKYFIGLTESGFVRGDLTSSTLSVTQLPTAPILDYFSPDGTKFATCNKEKLGYIVRVWNAATGEQVKIFTPFAAAPRFKTVGNRWGVTSFSPEDGQKKFRLITTDLDTGDISQSDTLVADYDESRAWAYQGYELLRLGNTVSIISPYNKTVDKLKNISSIGDAILSRSASTLVVPDKDSVTAYGFAAGHQTVKAFKAFNVNTMDVSPDGRFVAANVGGSLQIWDIQGERARLMMTVPIDATDLKFLGDGRRLVLRDGPFAKIIDLSSLHDDRDTVVNNICGGMFGPQSSLFRHFEMTTDPLLSSNWTENRKVCPSVAANVKAPSQRTLR